MLGVVCVYSPADDNGRPMDIYASYKEAADQTIVTATDVLIGYQVFDWNGFSVPEEAVAWHDTPEAAHEELLAILKKREEEADA